MFKLYLELWWQTGNVYCLLKQQQQSSITAGLTRRLVTQARMARGQASWRRRCPLSQGMVSWLRLALYMYQLLQPYIKFDEVTIYTSAYTSQPGRVLKVCALAAKSRRDANANTELTTVSRYQTTDADQLSDAYTLTNTHALIRDDATIIHHFRDVIRLSLALDRKRTHLEAARQAALLVRRRLLVLHHSLHCDVKMAVWSRENR